MVRDHVLEPIFLPRGRLPTRHQLRLLWHILSSMATEWAARQGGFPPGRSLRGRSDPALWRSLVTQSDEYEVQDGSISQPLLCVRLRCEFSPYLPQSLK